MSKENNAYTFSLKNAYNSATGLVACGSRVSGCVPIKDNGPFFDDTLADRPEALQAAEKEMNEVFARHLPALHAAAKEQGGHGLDMVATPTGLQLAFCHDDGPVLAIRHHDDMHVLRRVGFWLGKRMVFSRVRN